MSAVFALTFAGCDVFSDPVDPSWVPPPRPPRKEKDERDTDDIKFHSDMASRPVRNEGISVPALTFRQES